jgi:hypothetical protein
VLVAVSAISFGGIKQCSFSIKQIKIIFQDSDKGKNFSSSECLAFNKNIDLVPDIFSELLEELPLKLFTNGKQHGFVDGLGGYHLLTSTLNLAVKLQHQCSQ